MKLRTPGKFGHTFAEEIQMRRLPTSRLIRIFTVCLVDIFFISNNYNVNQTRSLSEFTWCPKLPDFTLYEYLHPGIYAAAVPSRKMWLVLSWTYIRRFPPQIKVLNMVIPILMRFYRLNLERCKPHRHKGECHQLKCDIINDVKLFPTVSPLSCAGAILKNRPVC